MSDFIIDEKWIDDFLKNIEELIADTLKYDGQHNLVPPLRPIVRCRDCRYSENDGTECVYFEAYEPISGGDEYKNVRAEVEPDGFCAWGEPR